MRKWTNLNTPSFLQGIQEELTYWDLLPSIYQAKLRLRSEKKQPEADWKLDIVIKCLHPPNIYANLYLPAPYPYPAIRERRQAIPEMGWW